MGLFINNQKYGAPYINGVRMQTAYINGRNIWPPMPPDAFYVQFVDSDSQPTVGKITPKWTVGGNNLEYKIRGKDWTSFNSGTQLTSGSDGKYIFAVLAVRNSFRCMERVTHG